LGSESFNRLAKAAFSLEVGMGPIVQFDA
jgi:hypothetical protein